MMSSWAASYLMFAENGDHVGQSLGLHGVWKGLVAGRSLEEEGTHSASSLDQSTPAWRLINGSRVYRTLAEDAAETLLRNPPPPKERRTSLDGGRLISTISYN